MAWFAASSIPAFLAPSIAGLLAQADPGSSGAPMVGGDPSGGAAASPAGGYLQLAMFAGIFVVFYFLVLRPQQKRAKTHKAFIDALAVGSRVVTTGGLFGKIVSLDGNECKLEIADRVVIRILKSQIAGLETNAAEAVASLTAR